jgi:UDP-galactopyranose mutase
MRFEHKLIDEPDYQGNAIFNYTEAQIPYTRIYEHKHFDLNYTRDKTAVTYEYPQRWKPGLLEMYPVNTENNLSILSNYQSLAAKEGLPITFGGRLGEYRYFDMHQVIGAALEKVKSLASS